LPPSFKEPRSQWPGIRGPEQLPIRENLPDLILLDIWLSGTNGAEIAQFLKSQDHTRHIPIILFSANRNIERLAQKAGVEDFLMKPFDLTDLVQTIQKYVLV
jgi:CheY-like chemotaxis protein